MLLWRLRCSRLAVPSLGLLGGLPQLVVGDLGHGQVVMAAAAASVSVVAVVLAVGGGRPELAGLVVPWHWWICPGLLHV